MAVENNIDIVAQAITAMVSVLISSGGIGMVYKVMKGNIDLLSAEYERKSEDYEKRISSLEAQLKASVDSSNRRLRGFYLLKQIITKHRCKGKDCRIYEEYLKFQTEQGDSEDEEIPTNNRSK